MRKLLVNICLMLLPSLTLAQARATGSASRQSPDSVFARAVSLNNEQRGAEARALIDSVMRAEQPISAVFGDALFWKGVMAESEQVAEESYKRIIVDFPLHRRAEESLIRLAQLEIMRGNRVQAQRYLDRIVVEHPYGRYRAKASYWRARLFFEENEIDRACAELGTARARLSDTDVELKTDIDVATQRCPSVPVPSAPPVQRSSGAAAAADRSTGRAAAPPARGVQQPPARSGATGRATTGSNNSAGRSASTTKAAAPKVMFAVQAAAFPPKDNAKESAEAFIDALKSRGYEARLIGSAAPYRVWVGLFATRAEASALATELKEKKISTGAFVVEAPGK